MPLPRRLCRDSITILRPQTVRDHGATVPDWTQPPAETVTVDGCSVQPAQGSDDRAHRDALQAVITLWAPPGTYIGALDRVLVDSYDAPLQITGEPLVWDTKLHNDHMTIQLAEWRG